MRKFLFCAVLVALTAAVRAQEFVFIAHPATAEAAVSSDEVKNILLGNKTKWDSGGVIKLVVLADGTLHDKIVQSFTQRNADQFDKYWKKQVFTGKGTLPAPAKSDADVIGYVAATPGSFGYIAKDSATDKVKVLSLK